MGAPWMSEVDRSVVSDQDALSIRRALSEIETLSTERRRFLAGYAYILVRLARAVEADAEERRRDQRQLLEQMARRFVAEVVGNASPGDVVFTGGGTEADNLAIYGILDRAGGVQHPSCLGIA